MRSPGFVSQPSEKDQVLILLTSQVRGKKKKTKQDTKPNRKYHTTKEAHK